MHETGLRTVLLIRAVDEGDKAGEVLSLPERAEATQAAAKGAGTIDNGLAGPALPPEAERLLVKRAELLLSKLQARSPMVAQVLDFTAGAGAIVAGLLAAAFACGLSMSALDGGHRIDILAFPLLGLISWNLLVYLTLLIAKLRSRATRSSRPSWLSSLYARAAGVRVEALLHQSSQFNVPLADTMRRFSQEWAVVARPGLVLRAKRLFHLGALVLALGLITGLYVRGLVLRYDAGWESTFLEPSQVRSLLSIVYGPAAWLSGVALPSEQSVEALRWNDAAAGVTAASWIHLIALTAALYIVLPRLLAVMLTSFALWRVRRKPELPAAFMAYARSLLLTTGRVRGLRAAVVTYAYQPSRDALAGLRALLTDALGAEVTLEQSAAISYGEEDAFVERLRTQPLTAADCHVLLMSLAATPETENHGAMIAALKRALAKKPGGLLVLIDASAYAARIGDEPVRLAERTRSWQEFSTGQGHSACVVDLGKLRVGEAPDAIARQNIRDALHHAANA